LEASAVANVIMSVAAAAETSQGFSSFKPDDVTKKEKGRIERYFLKITFTQRLQLNSKINIDKKTY
jgi:hypothetical protein